MKYLLLALCLFTIGCNYDHPDFWEYEAHVSAKSTPEELVAIEKMLYSNGYKRVRIKYSYSFIRYDIFATRKEESNERADK